MPDRTIADLLKDRFNASGSVDALVSHFQGVVSGYHEGEWERSLGKAGKFLEAVLKTLQKEANLPSQVGRQFKVDKAINDLGALPAGAVDDSVRITIPRCCRFMYDVTSNRGGRHDPDEIDPNEMDATAMLSNCAWILAEMVRYAQKQRNLSAAKAVVEGLMKRRYPFIDEIDGRVYVDLESAQSARDLGLLILWHNGPKRMARDELVIAIRRQRRSVTVANAKMAVQRLADVVDDDGSGNLRLRAAGVREADDLIASAGK